MKTRQFTAMVIVFLFFFMGICAAEEKPKKKPCRDHPKLSGPCFKIRGRMAYYNGAPSLRIWPVGTTRILGVSEGIFYLEGYDSVPEELVRQMTTFDTVMFADFLVCPFTDNEPGIMRLVCIESAEHISIRKRGQHRITTDSTGSPIDPAPGER